MSIGTATSSAFELTTTDHSVSFQLSNGEPDYQSDLEPSHDASSLANTAASSSTAVVGSASSCTVSSNATLESSSLPKDIAESIAFSPV